MLDIKYIRENKKEVKKVCELKKRKVDIDLLLSLDEERRIIQSKIDELGAKRNELAGGAKVKPSKEQIEAGKKLKQQLGEKEAALKGVEQQFNQILMAVPNITSSDTPVGKDESENKVLRKVGKPVKFKFEPKDHMELGESLGLIDTEKSAAIAGARFNYLFGDAVLLQFAVLNFVLATLTDEKIIGELAKKVGNPSGKPFIPVLPPVMAKGDIMKKMDRYEPLEDRYYFPNDDVLMIGSAEHTLGPLHSGEIIPEEDLPIRYIGYSTAFRREAGSYGKDTSGIFRRHQFDKAEMECFTTAEHGAVEQDLIIAIQEYLISKLELPYQVVSICTGDMGKPDFRQVDMECYLPGQKAYRETHTSDYMTDYQARRLNIKYKTKQGKKEFVHMNDATAFAMGRILIALLENHQQDDGSIKVPEALRPYFPGNIEYIKSKQR